MQPVKTFIYQTTQIRELERLALERLNLSGTVLMQRAGVAACEFLLRRWPQAKKIAVFCGAGNNGGDGYVLANQAKQHGLDVTIWQLGNHEQLSEATQAAHQACQKAHIEMNAFSEHANLQHPEVIVDAICGIGLHQALREETVAAIRRMHRAHAPIFSLDVPTGIDADTGCVLGAAVQATATMTFIGLKIGLLTGSGMAYTGELVSHDLQLSPELFSYVEPVAEKIHFAAFSTYLKPRLRDWHKGLSGHVLIVGGDVGYSGAPRMAGEAALRVGAGLVTLATHPANAALANALRPELMCYGVTHPNELQPLLEKIDVIVLGPGLGKSDWGKALWEYCCAQELPMVVDADALNLLATTDKTNEHWVLTPHPGEASRLLDDSVQSIQEDRLTAVKAITKKYDGVCVLKGAGSLVAAPNALPALCNKGNPGMATAGMGDILSGVIGGLIAQGIPLGEAAKLGVSLHAMAGDLAAKEGERGMVAMDLMPYLRRLANSV